jgi:hypothetical protein
LTVAIPVADRSEKRSEAMDASGSCRDPEITEMEDLGETAHEARGTRMGMSVMRGQ